MNKTTIYLHLLENGALASAYKTCVQVFESKRRTYSVGQEILNHSYLAFQVDEATAQVIYSILQQPNQTYIELNNALLDLLGGAYMLSDSSFGWVRVSIGNLVKTAYNIHTLYDFEQSFLRITNLGGFTLRASHFYTHNSVNDEILALIDLLDTKPITDNYRIDDLRLDEKIVFATSKVIFELDYGKGTALNKKIYRYDKKDQQTGEFIRLKILQADRAGVIPCVKLCQYMARFLESMTDGYRKHNLLDEFNKDVNDPDITINRLLEKYDYNKIISQPMHFPTVQGIFE